MTVRVHMYTTCRSDNELAGTVSNMVTNKYTIQQAYISHIHGSVEYIWELVLQICTTSKLLCEPNEISSFFFFARERN